MYVLRPVTGPDMPRICGFFNTEKELAYSFPDAGYPLQEKDLIASIERRSDSCVLIIDDLPVGFANLFNIAVDVDCHLGNVVIDRLYRRKGAASRLIREMESLAAEKYRVKKMIIPCWSENTPALTVYAKLGFKPFDIVLRNFSRYDSVPVLLLEKSIPAVRSDGAVAG